MVWLFVFLFVWGFLGWWWCGVFFSVRPSQEKALQRHSGVISDVLRVNLATALLYFSFMPPEQCSCRELIVLDVLRHSVPLYDAVTVGGTISLLSPQLCLSIRFFYFS